MRIILDTNVWTYVAERDERTAFEALEDSLDLKVVVPPSVLLEAIRTPVPELRTRIVGALATRGASRIHPLPEARLEADELVVESRRLRRPWLRQFPDTSRTHRLETFWTRKIWQTAARDPSVLADTAASAGMDAAADKLLEAQKTNKAGFLAANVPFEDLEPWADLDGQPDEVTSGWNGKRIDAWRFETAAMWWRELVMVPRRARRLGGDTTFADWAGAWLKLDALARDRTSWNRFWYHEVDPKAMPRNWIHAVMAWAQLQTKIGAGNPRDSQHAAYLFDADMFLTADRRYRSVLELVRRWCPRPFARASLIPGEGSAVEAIRDILAAGPAQSQHVRSAT